MRRLLNIILFLSLFLFVSCELDFNNVVIPIIENSELKGTKPPTDFIKSTSEGIYYSSLRGNPFGDSLVFKWSGNYLSIFTGKNTNYMILETGFKNNEIIFEGYWREANSDINGIIKLKITPNNGGTELCSDKIPSSIKVTGTFSGASGNGQKELEFILTRPFKFQNKDFRIIAHKGGGRNIDRLPHAENSIEMIEYSERLGANAIEIDVQLTKDKIPVLFHDEFLSKRTINEDYFIGRVSDYNFKLLTSFVTLKNYSGSTVEEKIPTLENVLDAVVNKTNLKLIWLDVKDPAVIDYIIPIQNKYIDFALSKGKKLEILIGIPDESVYNKIKSINNFNSIPTLCELDENYVEGAGSIIWAPRWSMGLMNDRVNQIHNKSKRAFVWTLDDPALIRTYFREGNFDGIVTNFSPYVAYEYYMGK